MTVPTKLLNRVRNVLLVLTVLVELIGAITWVVSESMIPGNSLKPIAKGLEAAGAVLVILTLLITVASTHQDLSALRAASTATLDEVKRIAKVLQEQIELHQRSEALSVALTRMHEGQSAVVPVREAGREMARLVLQDVPHFARDYAEQPKTKVLSVRDASPIVGTLTRIAEAVVRLAANSRPRLLDRSRHWLKR